MKRNIFSVFVVIIALCSTSCEKGSLYVVGDVIEIKDEAFTKIYSSSFYNIKLVKSNSSSVRVEIPKAFEDKIDFEVEIVDGVLKLESTISGGVSINEGKDGKIMAYISTPTLEEINLDGICTLESEAFSFDGKFKLTLDGISEITTFTINCIDLDLDVRGLSTLVATVNVRKHANISVSGMSTCKLGGSAKTATVNIEGSTFNGDGFWEIGDF